MTRLVEFPLDSGGTILVETDDSNAVVTRGWRDQGARLAEQAQQSFERAIDQIRPAADALLTSLTNTAHAPDEVTVEFAIQLSAEAGAVIASLGSTANFKVALKWNRKDNTPPRPR